MNLRLGIKIYDNDWFLRHHLSPEAAADILAQMGVTFVIAQSRFLPMQDSAVESNVRASQASDYAALDDVAFRHALAARGIGYFACLNICFDPAFTAAHPELLPIDQFGKPEQMQDWYIGLPPDRVENLQHKIAMLENAVSALSPDGVHLGFIRWPDSGRRGCPTCSAHPCRNTATLRKRYSYSARPLERMCPPTTRRAPPASSRDAIAANGAIGNVASQ